MWSSFIYLSRPLHIALLLMFNSSIYTLTHMQYHIPFLFHIKCSWPCRCRYPWCLLYFFNVPQNYFRFKFSVYCACGLFHSISLFKVCKYLSNSTIRTQKYYDIQHKTDRKTGQDSILSLHDQAQRPVMNV